MPPPAPDAPTLHAHGEDAVRVEWTLPHGMDNNVAYVSLKADGDSTWHRFDAATGELADDADAYPVLLPSTECVVRGLDPSLQYIAKFRLGGSCGWGPDSATSKGLTLASLRPIVPGPPLLEAVDETSLRVHFRTPPKLPGAPDHERVGVIVRAGGGARQVVDAATSALMNSGRGTAHPASCTVADVKGLSAGETYQARISVKNACGWGPTSPLSDPVKLPGSELETTGSGTPNVTPKESRKRALETTSPPAARAKTASTGARSESRISGSPGKRPKKAAGFLTKLAAEKKRDPASVVELD